MPTDLSIPEPASPVNLLTDQERASLREELLRLRYRLLQPLSAEDYWRLHDRAEELSTLLAAPVRAISPRCEPAIPPVYATFETRPTLKRARTRLSKDA